MRLPAKIKVANTLCMGEKKKEKAFLDTGCSKSLSYELAHMGNVGPAKKKVIMMNGKLL